MVIEGRREAIALILRVEVWYTDIPECGLGFIEISLPENEKVYIQ